MAPMAPRHWTPCSDASRSNAQEGGPPGGVLDGWRVASFDDARPSPLAPHAPVMHATWYEAEAYCAWVGGRLLTEAEWAEKRVPQAREALSRAQAADEAAQAKCCASGAKAATRVALAEAEAEFKAAQAALAALKPQEEEGVPPQPQPEPAPVQ